MLPQLHVDFKNNIQLSVWSLEYVWYGGGAYRLDLVLKRGWGELRPGVSRLCGPPLHFTDFSLRKATETSVKGKVGLKYKLVTR